MRFLQLLTFAAFGFSSFAYSAILPDTIGPLQRGTPVAAPAADAKIWEEYGFQEGETAPYTDPASAARKISITAYRFQDSTGAFAAWLELRPAGSHSIETDGLGAEADDIQYIEVGNYLMVFRGLKPNREELGHIYLTAPHYSHALLPIVRQYLPEGANLNSERYILGPESLAKYAPAIPPSTAAFHFSSEGEAADYVEGKAKTTVVVFNFPAIEMAQKQYALFEQVPGAVAKRTGPLVAIALHPSSADAAERLLSHIKYQAEVTLPEHVPTLRDNPANLFLNIIILCGVLIGVCLAGGIAVGGMRWLRTRSGKANEGEEMITLHISDRS